MKKFIALVIFFIPFLLQSQTVSNGNPGSLGASTQGKEFWFSVIPGPDVPTYKDSVFINISSIYNTSVTLTLPSKNLTIVKSVIANKTAVISLMAIDAMVTVKGAIAPELPEQVYPGAGIHLISEDPISANCVAQLSGYSEGMLCLPVSSLGDSYICSSYNSDPMFGAIWNYKEPAYSAVTAAFDNTKVKFIVGGNYASQTAGGKKPGQFIDVTLQAGDVLLVSSKGDMGDLAGSKILSTKPISVVSGNSLVNIPAGNQWPNFCMETELPDFTWGKDYHLFSIPNRKYASLIRIYAKEPNTTIYRDGKQIGTLKQSGGIIGEAYIEMRVTPMDQSQKPIVYSGNKPIGVTLYNCGVQEDGFPLPNTAPFIMSMIPYQQYQKEIIFSVPESNGVPIFKENYLILIYQMDENGMIPPNLEFGELWGNQIEWSPVRTRFQSIDPEFQYDVEGRHFARKVITLSEAGSYRIRSQEPFTAYSYGCGYCDSSNGNICGSYGFPVSYILSDLEKEDTLPPEPKYSICCYGEVRNGTVTDKPDDSDIRSNLGFIDMLDDSSYNCSFDYKDFIPGQTVTTTWELSVQDFKKAARAFLIFADRRGNDTVINIKYEPPQLEILPSSYTFTNLKIGDIQGQEFTLYYRSDKGPYTLTSLYLDKNNQGFEMLNPSLPFTIPPKGSMKFHVKFKATAEGFFHDVIMAGDSALSLPYSDVYAYVGKFSNDLSDLEVIPDSIDFGTIDNKLPAMTSISLRNKSADSYILLDSTSLKFNSNVFVLQGLTLPYLLPPAGISNLTLQFKSAVNGNFLDSLGFGYAGKFKYYALLTGAANGPFADLLEVNPAVIIFDSCIVNRTYYLNCSIKNNYVLSLKTIDLKFGSIYFFIDSLKSPFELANGEVSDFRVGFSGNSIGTYYDTLYATDGSGNSILAFAIANVTQPTGIEENKNENFSIDIIPQPAGDDAELKIALTESAIVNIKISDILGSTVMNVENNEIMAPGTHSLPINLRGNSNGFYIVHLQVGGVWISRRFILLR